MSSIPHNAKNENVDSATNFLKEFQIGKLLFQRNAGKMKGMPVINIFRYLFCLIFSDRSMYMRRKTGVFDGGSDIVNIPLHCFFTKSLSDFLQRLIILLPFEHWRQTAIG